MINTSGYIKFYRKILNWEWFTDVNTCHFFHYCLLRANYDSQRFMGVEIPRGSFVSSLDSMSMETGLSVQNIRTCIKKLEKSKNLTSKSTNKFTIINIVNYEVYQDENFETNKQINKRLTNDQQTTNNNKRNKEIKNINNYILYGEFQNVKLTDEEHQKLVDEFGQDGTDAIIKILDTYKGSSGKKYKSDYLAIRNWVVDRYKQDQKKKEDNVSFLDL